MEHGVETRRATTDDIDQLCELFDLYRQFYAQRTDLNRARGFLLQRLSRKDSVILVAFRGLPRLLGFAQLYPTFCSISTARIYILYDLFVSADSRRVGVGRALLHAAKDYAVRARAARLELATAKSNLAAQTLYQSLGWLRDDDFDRYSLPLS
jgi:ribosomal protein S18 acetylase RimI-like enzyme